MGNLHNIHLRIMPVSVKYVDGSIVYFIKNCLQIQEKQSIDRNAGKQIMYIMKIMVVHACNLSTQEAKARGT
jgi:hypothetical protein